MFGKRGLSVAVWIWIVGGVILASILFLVVFYNVFLLGSTTSKQSMVDQFRKLRDDIDFVCSQGIGTVIPKELNLKGVQAIYASEKPGDVDPKAPLYVVQGNRSYGNYLCISFEEGDYECSEKISCKINITYMGTPVKGSDMYEIGIADGSFDFKVLIEKREHGKVLVTGTHVP